MTQQECTVYRCEHCRKLYLRRHACAWHEKHCSRNPNNQHVCYDCPHLEKEVYEADGLGEHRYVTYTCKKLGKEMHTYVAERRKHSCLKYTERMPLSCPEHPEAIRAAIKVTAMLMGLPMPKNDFELEF